MNIAINKLPVVATGILFFLMVWFTSAKFGIGLTPDSAGYLITAQSLRQGRGLVDDRGHVSAHSPPGYPALLAATSIATFRDVRHGAPRLLAAVAFAVVACVTFLLLEMYTQNPLAVACACVGVGGHPQLLLWASTALSEMPCLAILACSALLYAYWHRYRKGYLLVAAAVAAGAAIMTRYVAIVWPLAAALAIIFPYQRIALWSQLRAAVCFIGISLLPLLTWVGYTLLIANSAPRQWAYHPISLSTLADGCQQLAASVGLQTGFSGAIVLAFCVLGITTSVWLPKGFLAGEPAASHVSFRPLLAGLLFIVGYFAFLVFSISFLDRATPMDGRLFVPVTWFILVLTCTAICLACRRQTSILAVVLWLMLVWFAGRAIFETVPRAASWHDDGIDLACAEVLYDKSFRWIRESCPPETAILSNVSWTTFLATKRSVQQLSSRVDYTTGRINPSFNNDLQDVVQQVKAGSVVILIDTQYSDPNFLPPTADELAALGIASDPVHSTQRFLIFR